MVIERSHPSYHKGCSMEYKEQREYPKYHSFLFLKAIKRNHSNDWFDNPCFVVFIEETRSGFELVTCYDRHPVVRYHISSHERYRDVPVWLPGKPKKQIILRSKDRTLQLKSASSIRSLRMVIAFFVRFLRDQRPFNKSYCLLSLKSKHWKSSFHRGSCISISLAREDQFACLLDTR